MDLWNHVVRLRKEFDKAVRGMTPVKGCYNAVIRNNVTGEEKETQGDIHREAVWDTYFVWLLTDMTEMGIGDIEDLSILDITYTGTENLCTA